jgi:hypothetical protein
VAFHDFPRRSFDTNFSTTPILVCAAHVNAFIINYRVILHFLVHLAFRYEAQTIRGIEGLSANLWPHGSSVARELASYALAPKSTSFTQSRPKHMKITIGLCTVIQWSHQNSGWRTRHALQYDRTRALCKLRFGRAGPNSVRVVAMPLARFELEPCAITRVVTARLGGIVSSIGPPR